jgi:hypothetical protein
MALAWKVRDLLRFPGLTGNYRTQSMNKNIIRLAAIAALAVGAQANTITKSATSPAGFIIPTSPSVGAPGNPGTPTGISHSVSVPQPTPAETLGFGFLVGISYEISFGTYATYTLTDVPGNLYTVQWGLGSLPDPNGLNAVMGTDGAALPIAISVFSVPAISSQLVPGNASGTTTQQLFTTASTPVAMGDFSSYTTGGTTAFAFTAGTVSGVLGQNSQTSPSVFQGATVTVTYTYSDIPEPSTYAAGAVLLAGAGFIARRRMQKA